MSDQQLGYIKLTIGKLEEVTRAGWETHSSAVDNALRDLLDESRTLARMYLESNEICESCNDLESQLDDFDDEIGGLEADVRDAKEDAEYRRDMVAEKDGLIDDLERELASVQDELKATLDERDSLLKEYT